MGFLKSIFGKKEEPIKNYSDFWDWFVQHEKTFYNAVKSRENIEKVFFNKLSPKLAELQEDIFFLTGMYNDDTVELILTADANIKKIVFAEEFVSHAPEIKSWKFTALKPASNIEDVSISMAGYEFDSEHLFFYFNEQKDYPDEIDISVVHTDMTADNAQQIINGVYLFLDNYLGELDFVSTIDNLTIIGKHEAEKELVPIAKLKDFLNWRQKEFVEKYDGVRYNTADDEHAVLQADLESGNKLLAVINTQLLNWDSKASHPWIAMITFKFDGKHNNGMPNENDYSRLNQIEEELLQQFSDKDGYLYIGRQTADSERDVFFACKEFRKPSKVFFKTQQDCLFDVEYIIYKDKYWKSFERFNPGN